MSLEKLPLELKLGLRTGSVFYFRARELTSDLPHFFVVLNQNPLEEKLLLLTVFTSQIDKVRLRNRERPHTVVEFGPEDYGPLRGVSPRLLTLALVKKSLNAQRVDLLKQEQETHRQAGPAIAVGWELLYAEWV